MIIGNLKQEQNKDSLLIDIQYFGNVDWYKLLFQFTNIEIEQYETYQKMSFRNRCTIVGSNGLINLSVPLEKGRGQKLLMKDVKISYSENWEEQHWRSICACYGNSPFFEFYEESLKSLFQKKHRYLMDLNWHNLEWVNKRLKNTLQFQKSGAYLIELPNNYVDARNTFKPNTIHQVKETITYQQVFEDRIGFKPHLCILDLMFCNGPASKSLLANNFRNN